jgi:hypothetical protein
MAKKKKNEEGAQPEFPSMPTEDLTGAFPSEGYQTGAFPTEGFGGPSGMTGDLGVPTEGFTGAHGVPTEGFPRAPKSATGAHGWTEGMSGEHGALPTEGFTRAAPSRATPRPGGGELQELDDVLVLLPEEDEAPTHRHTGDVIRNPIGADVTIRATTSHLPGSESPTALEDVRLLAQHPDEGILPVEDYQAMRAMDDLPDIEDVEDITSLVEEAVSTDMPAPRADFEDEYAMSPRGTARRGGGFSSFVRIAAAAAIIVAGALYGPDLYDRYLADGTKTVAGTQGSNGTAGTSVSTGQGPGGTVTTPVDPNSAGQPASVAFRGWVDGVLAAHFGTSVPTER